MNAIPEEEEEDEDIEVETKIPKFRKMETLTMNKIRLTEEDSIIMRSDNLPIVDLSKYHTDSKEAHYIQNNHIVNQLTTIKEITEDPIKKTEFDFMLDLKTLISKTETVTAACPYLALRLDKLYAALIRCLVLWTVTKQFLVFLFKGLYLLAGGSDVTRGISCDSALH